MLAIQTLTASSDVDAVAIDNHMLTEVLEGGEALHVGARRLVHGPVVEGRVPHGVADLSELGGNGALLGNADIIGTDSHLEAKIGSLNTGRLQESRVDVDGDANCELLSGLAILGLLLVSLDGIRADGHLEVEIGLLGTGHQSPWQ